MSNQPLASVPAELESVGGELSEALYRRYAVLVARAVVPPQAAAFLKSRGGSAEQTMDEFATLALQNDALTVVTFACLSAGGEFSWARLEGLRPTLARIASFYSLVLRGYEPFRALPRERVGEFVNRYASSSEPFGLRCRATRFLGLALCAHAGEPLLDRMLTRVLRPLWDGARAGAGTPPEVASAFWEDVEARAAELRADGRAQRSTS